MRAVSDSFLQTRAINPSQMAGAVSAGHDQSHIGSIEAKLPTNDTRRCCVPVWSITNTSPLAVEEYFYAPLCAGGTVNKSNWVIVIWKKDLYQICTCEYENETGYCSATTQNSNTRSKTMPGKAHKACNSLNDRIFDLQVSSIKMGLKDVVLSPFHYTTPRIV